MTLRKKHNGHVYEVFPLEITHAQVGQETVYDRDTRGRSWFVLDLILPLGKFIPMDSTGLVTADEKSFLVGRRRT